MASDVADSRATGAEGEPTDDLAGWVYERLVEMYGVPKWEPDGDALGGLIATILSQHTSDLNSGRAYERLRQSFPDWAAVRDAPVAAVADVIRVGGLAQMKAERIQATLRALSQRQAGAPQLDHLSALPVDAALSDLQSLPGVGPKTAACVLLFSLGRPVFPVDTHVWRVTRRLGLIGPKVTADAAHKELELQIPPARRHTMHINLIRHGRQVCHAQRPACAVCDLRARCQYYWASVAADH